MMLMLIVIITLANDADMEMMFTTVMKMMFATVPGCVTADRALRVQHAGPFGAVNVW